MSHPHPALLVALAGTGAGPVDPAIAAHVAACPDCADALRELQALAGEIAVVQGLTPPGAGCLTDDTVADLVDGTLTDEARAEAVRHLGGCATCRRAVAGVARAMADPAILAADPARQAPRRPWLGRVAVATAAAAAIALMVLVDRGPGPTPDPGTHRAPSVTASERPAVIAPAGLVPPPAALRWGAVPGADLYRVSLFAANGAVLYAAESPDTVVALPDSVRLVAGASYAWIVEARTDWGRWATSDLSEFTLSPAAP